MVRAARAACRGGLLSLGVDFQGARYKRLKKERLTVIKRKSDVKGFATRRVIPYVTETAIPKKIFHRAPPVQPATGRAS